MPISADNIKYIIKQLIDKISYKPGINFVKRMSNNEQSKLNTYEEHRFKIIFKVIRVVILEINLQIKISLFIKGNTFDTNCHMSIDNIENCM